MTKKILISMMIVAIAIAFMPVNTFAASKTEKTKFYEVYKDGNTVYCATTKAIYKVKVTDKGKYKSKEKIAKAGEHLYIRNLKKKGEYLYVTANTEGTPMMLGRVKTDGGKIKNLVTEELEGVAIKGKKIYYSYYSDSGKLVKKEMKLNGKDKKKSKVKPVSVDKRTNAKGYKLIVKYHDDYEVYYLKTPKGKYKLGKRNY